MRWETSGGPEEVELDDEEGGAGLEARSRERMAWVV